MEIITPRLTLRKPRLEDVDTVHNALTSVWSQLQQWMSWAYDGHETREAVERYIRLGLVTENVTNTPLLGFDLNNRFVISTGIHLVEGSTDEYETGYWVAQEQLGQGYATEATNAIIRYAFNELQAKAFHINYYADNEKSRRVIEKLGFEFVKTKPAYHKRCSDGTMLDSHEYIMRDPAVLPPLRPLDI